MATPDETQGPKNPFKPGKTSLSDLLKNQPEPGRGIVFDRPAPDLEKLPKSKSGVPDTYDDTGVASAYKRRPGLGEPGKSFISSELTAAEEYDIWGISEAYSEEPKAPADTPPSEPPGDSEGTEPIEELPPPEYIYEIKQSSKPYPYKAARPDLIDVFYGDGPDRSTRVRAMQWVPTEKNGDVVVGDIFVAFARPSEGKSALVLYTGLTEALWENFKKAKSLGVYVNEVLKDYGPVKHGPEQYKRYKDLHPSYEEEEYIFDPSNLAKWYVIRSPNSAGTDVRKPRSIEGKAKVAAERMEKRGKGYSYFRTGLSDDDED